MGLKFNIALSLVWVGLSMPVYAQQAQSSGGSTPQEYEGPSILSRDSTLIGERGGKLIDFRLYGSVTGVYDTGLVPVSTDQNGNLINVGGNAGVEAGFGAIGSKTWKRDSLSLEYRGTYRHYTQNPYFDGTDQFLNLRYGRILTRRITLDLKETAGTTSLGNGAFSYLPLTTSDLTAVPANELFDNRTYFTQTRAGLVWQKSARLSFSVSGEGFIVRRQAISLAGLTGYVAHADSSYRLTRRQTLTANYDYSNYDYTRTFGSAVVQTASLGYSIGLGRTYDINLTGGGSYLDLRGLQTIQVDPAIVAIIGQPTVVSTFHRQLALPYAQVRFQRRFPRASLSAIVASQPSPGNGVYLTSRQTLAGANYSYSGIQRWTFGGNFGYSELSTLGQSLGKYRGVQGGVGSTYKLNSPLHLEFRYDYRHYTTGEAIFRKDSNRISIGLAFSPGDTPLAIW